MSGFGGIGFEVQGWMCDGKTTSHLHACRPYFFVLFWCLHAWLYQVVSYKAADHKLLVYRVTLLTTISGNDPVQVQIISS